MRKELKLREGIMASCNKVSMKDVLASSPDLPIASS